MAAHNFGIYSPLELFRIYIESLEIEGKQMEFGTKSEKMNDTLFTSFSPI